MLKLTNDVYQVMQEDAENKYPNECVGFCFGEDGHPRVVTEARPVTNSKEGDQRRRFEVSARDYMEAEQHAARTGQTLLGVYHSHPDHPAQPSEHDRKQAVPFFSYIILSVQKGEVDNTTSWLLNEEGQFDEEELQYEPTLTTNL